MFTNPTFESKGQFIGFHFRILFLKLSKESVFLISSGIILHIIGPNTLNVFSPLVWLQCQNI